VSSILKALKKLEAEKSALEEGREINLSREILRPPVKSGISPKWFWLLGSLAALVITLLIFALMRKPVVSDVTPKGVQPVTSQPVSAPPMATQRPAGSDKAVQNAAPPPAALPVNKEIPQPPLKPRSDTTPKTDKIELPGSTLPTPEIPRKEPATAAPQPRTSPREEPGLSLSGIAWNKDSSDRLAIINGQPIAIGSTVGGAVVEEILPDRVKLSINGRKFELLIGRNARTE
jgi:hypothetical protein